MSPRFFLKSVVSCALLLFLVPDWTFAQGCVCQKQGGPLFGGVSPYMGKGDWQLLFYYRGYMSTEHFQGKEPFPVLDANGPRNGQHLFNLDAAYSFSDRWSLAVSAPIYFNSFDVRRPVPGTTDRVWVPINSAGLGDISVRGRYWVFDPEGSNGGARNIGLSLGTKLPTGAADKTDDYFGRQVPVDVSIQPGDNSWGGTASLYAFQNIGPVTLFGAGNYLFVPQNTTGTPTFFGSLTNPNNTVLNSAADQFSTQFGGSVQLKSGWPVPSLVYRVEGVPINDLFGASDGFRRPGTIGFIEPGLNFAIGNHLFGVSVAFRSYVNIKDAPNSVRVEDATVPKYMFTAAYSVRF